MLEADSGGTFGVDRRGQTGVALILCLGALFCVHGEKRWLESQLLVVVRDAGGVVASAPKENMLKFLQKLF